MILSCIHFEGVNIMNHSLISPIQHLINYWKRQQQYFFGGEEGGEPEVMFFFGLAIPQNQGLHAMAPAHLLMATPFPLLMFASALKRLAWSLLSLPPQLVRLCRLPGTFPFFFSSGYVTHINLLYIGQ